MHRAELLASVDSKFQILLAVSALFPVFVAAVLNEGVYAGKSAVILTLPVGLHLLSFVLLHLFNFFTKTQFSIARLKFLEGYLLLSTLIYILPVLSLAILDPSQTLGSFMDLTVKCHILTLIFLPILGPLLILLQAILPGWHSRRK